MRKTDYFRYKLYLNELYQQRLQFLFWFKIHTIVSITSSKGKISRQEFVLVEFEWKAGLWRQVGVQGEVKVKKGAFVSPAIFLVVISISCIKLTDQHKYE